MNFKNIILTIDEQNIAKIILNRPKVHNAINLEMIREIRKVVDELNENQDVRAVILTGIGKSFCSGVDLKWMQKISKQNRQERIAEATEISEMLFELDKLNKLLIGRINGNSFGGAIGLITCCDIVIAVEDAVFALTEVLLGLLPATISPFVLKKIGATNARRIMLNAHRFSAKSAMEYGLISEVVPLKKLDYFVEKEINDLLRCAPEAVAATKILIAEVRGKDLKDMRTPTVEKLASAWDSESVKEGIEAFFDKRKPFWDKIS